MAFYRGANIRLTKETSENLMKTCYPGPDEETLGRYARLRPQYIAFQAFDKAHIIMLCEQGWLTRQEAADMLRVLRELERGDVEEARAATGEHWHAGEAILTQALGKEVGGKMHIELVPGCGPPGRSAPSGHRDASLYPYAACPAPDLRLLLGKLGHRL